MFVCARTYVWDVYREQILQTKRQVGKLKGSQIVTIGGRFSQCCSQVMVNTKDRGGWTIEGGWFWIREWGMSTQTPNARVLGLDSRQTHGGAYTHSQLVCLWIWLNLFNHGPARWSKRAHTTSVENAKIKVVTDLGAGFSLYSYYWSLFREQKVHFD